MHWFDMDVAGPEIARVLEPDGILAGLWTVFDSRVDWVAGLERVSGSAAIGPRDTMNDTPELFRVTVEVSDLETATRLYADLFGEGGQRHPGGRHYFDCGEVIVAVLDVSQGGMSPTSGPKSSLFFAVDDVKAVHARAERLGGKRGGRTQPTGRHTSNPHKTKQNETHSLPEASPWRLAGGSYRCCTGGAGEWLRSLRGRARLADVRFAVVG
jgi:predicted enzyme related to lactoylglutathione lyase